MVVATSCLLVATEAAAQTTHTVRGVVEDSLGAMVIGAEVSAVGVPYRSITDAQGQFVLSGIVGSSTQITARRLGYTPRTVPVVFQDSGSVTDGLVIRLNHIPTMLNPVLVQERKIVYTGRLAGYYTRLEKKNNGYFITRDQIDKESGTTLTQLLQHAPGIQGSRGRGGLQGIRMRNRNCWPLVWIDGTPMPAGEVDLDSFAPHTLHGIELYLGSTTAPSQYILPRNMNSCGTILLWSRGPDTDPIISSPRPGRDLKSLIQSLSIFSADEVDSQAVLKEGLQVKYPAGLFAQGLDGAVTAEFVVDSLGIIDPETIGIVASTHPLFSESVREALGKAAFVPAVRKGRRVRQLVLLPFTFRSRADRAGSQ